MRRYIVALRDEDDAQKTRLTFCEYAQNSWPGQTLLFFMDGS